MKVKTILIKIGIGILIAGGTCGALYGVSKLVINAKNQPSDPSVKVNNVLVTPNETRLKIGNSITLEAIVKGINDPPETVKWSSENAAICKVDEEGVITGVAVGETTVYATSTYDKNKKGSCYVTVVDKSAEPTEDEVIEILNEDEYVSYGNTPRGDNNDRIVYDEKAEPLEIKETYTETFENKAESRLLVKSVETGAKYSIIVGTDEKAIDGSKALYLESEGDYAGITFAGMKYSDNATYKIDFDYKVIQQSNDFFLQFRSYKGGYDKDVYVAFNGTPNSVQHCTHYFDLGNYIDYKLSIFPRTNAGKIVVDNIEITRIYSRPRLSSTEIASNGNMNVGDTLTFNYTFDDPNGLFSEKVTSYYWFSSVTADGLNKHVIAKNTKSITLTSAEDNKFIGVSYKTTSTLNSNDEYDAYGRQKDSIETSTVTSQTVGGLAPSVSKDHIFVPDVALTQNFESYNPLVSNINYLSSEKKSYVYTQTENVISGNRSLYVESPGYFDGFATSGYTLKPNTKYEVEFNYKFISKPSSFYVQMRSKSSNGYDVFETIDIASIALNTVYHFKGEFTTLNMSDYYLQAFGNNDPYVAIFDDLSIVERQAEHHDEEPTVHPSSLDNIGDYALETFGDSDNKVLNYDGTNVIKDNVLNSYAYKFTSNGNREIYIPFTNQLVSSGCYSLDIDYVVTKKGTGNFYFSIYLNDSYSDSMEKQCTDLTLNTKLSIHLDFDVTGKNISKNLLKVFTYYANGEFEVHFDNVKITKCKTPSESDPLIYAEVDGGTVKTETSPIIGDNAFHFVSNGNKGYEKLYIKTTPKLSAGSYTLTFDYCFTQFTTNTVYLAVYQLGDICKIEEQKFDVSLNTKHSYTVNFTLTSKLDFVRIMTGQNSGIMDIYVNNLIFTKK